MNIGSFSIPDMRLHPTPIDDVKKMYNKFEQKYVDYTTLASVLGHKSAKSGSFTAKMAVMRNYNLIDGRGEVRVTETGRKIAQAPSDPQELNEGLIEAVTSIPLWKEIYEKYTDVGKELPSSDFWLTLREICHVSPEEAQNKADIIRKAYLEDIKDIKPPRSEGGGFEGMDGEPQIPRSVPSIVIETFKIGDIEIKLPKEGLREAWEKAKKIIDIYVGNE